MSCELTNQGWGGLKSSHTCAQKMTETKDNWLMQQPTGGYWQLYVRCSHAIMSSLGKT